MKKINQSNVIARRALARRGNLEPFGITKNFRLLRRPLRGLLAMTFMMLGCILFLGCDGAIESEYQEQVVVEGFIYPGEGIGPISLHYTTPFTQPFIDSVYAISGADVRITVDSNEYVLFEGVPRGRYYLSPSKLVVQGGKTYLLTVKVKNHIVTATTIVPAPITYTNLDTTFPKNRVLLLDTNNATTFTYVLNAAPVDHPGRKYMLQVTALDTAFGKVSTGRQGPPVDTSARVRYSFIQTAPHIIIYSRMFGWFGPNRLTFLALDSNWVDYKRAVGYGENSFIPYQSSLNHISGGIGVWASAGRDTVTVFLKPKP